MPLGVGVLSFLTHSFLPDTTSSAVLRVSRWPRLTERARCVLDPGVCEPVAELMSRAAEGRLRREKEWEEAPRTGLPGGTGRGRAGSGGSGELTPRRRGWHTPAPRLSRDPAGKRGLCSHPQRVMSRRATSTQTLSSFSLFNVGPLLGIYLCFVHTRKNYLFISGCIRS